MTRNIYEIPGQAGKLAVVTGASDGLGLQIATRLASAGADLVLPVRNPRKGAAAVERIRAAAPRASITISTSRPWSRFARWATSSLRTADRSTSWSTTPR
jgi:NAD(P)-dependent dehydrogenase (short-subunit alcohol dehydrogenase family)